MTTEIERIKILEGKISHVAEYMRSLLDENQKLKKEIQELKSEKGDFVQQAKRAEKLDTDIKRYKADREVVREKIEALIEKIDQLGI
ncbi:MAG: cell division protein ZapB [Candidatus Aminicenantes bacterium]|nr:cell division protein ZapB [Candidatus Aminicenantes bacterium]